jgi:transcriptional regulator with XRE-family HTH domain
MSEMSVRMSRAARGLLGWSQFDLAAKSGLGRATIAAFEAGTANVASRTLRDIAAAFDAAGVIFIDPVEGVHQGAVALKWGVNLPERAPDTEGKAGKANQAGSQASAWDDGIDAIHEEAPPAADPEIEELRAYWRTNPEKWTAMHRSTRWALLDEMGLRQL